MERKRLHWDSFIQSIPKGVFILCIVLFFYNNLFGGDLVTKTNQSASWVRLPSRNASIGIDAVYYNPAGIMKLKNGLYISVSNQSVVEKREIENSYTGPGGAFGLNDHIYLGTVKELVFPAVYAVYKMKRLAYSFGINQIGGGGTTEYKKGLPSFEVNQSDLVPLLTTLGASGYRLNANIKGGSGMIGFQGGVAYMISNWLSVSVGLRYITGSNTFEGNVTDLELNLPAGWTKADALLRQISDNAAASAVVTTAFIGYGLGTLTFADVPADYLTSVDIAKLKNALSASGYPSTTKIEFADKIFKRAATNFDTRAKLFSDQTIDAKQSGSGITPFISINISPSRNINIGIKYEMATKLELTNKTKKDLTVGFEDDGTPVTLFKNSAKTRNDFPAMLAIGVDYRFSEKLKLSIGSNYFFDKTADYGHLIDADLNSSTPSIHFENRDIIDRNGISLQAGLEYNVSGKLLVSGGYVWANKGVNARYQSELTYGLASQTFGLGGAYNLSRKIQINLGGGYILYKDDTKVVDHIYSRTRADITANETYRKTTIMVALGADFTF